MSQGPEVLDAAAVARALEAWFAHSARALPWRSENPDPYRVWTSEAMLQQTRVETVVGRYGAFLERFPDLPSLARADEDEVLKAWEGLGYYRRARQLHACARVLAAQGATALPSEPEALATLPGFGPYMAGAVASIAFGRRVAATDANAVRVFARVGRLPWERGTAALLRAASDLHAAVVRCSHDPGALNQAVMDLGARVCRQRPACDVCPIRDHCAAFAQDGPIGAAALPRRAPARVRPERAVAMAVLADGAGAVLAQRRPPGLLGGLWGLPMAEAEGSAPESVDAALRGLEGSVGAAPGSLVQVGAFRWVFTHRTWQVEVYRGRAAGDGECGVDGQDRSWMSRAERQAAAFGGPFRQALALAVGDEAKPSRRSANPAP